MKKLRLLDTCGSFIDPETGFQISGTEEKTPHAVGSLTHAWLVGGGLIWVDEVVEPEEQETSGETTIPSIQDSYPVKIPSDGVLRGYTLAKLRGLLEELGESWNESETRRILWNRLKGIRDGKH